jgi:hypothetical protein
MISLDALAMKYLIKKLGRDSKLPVLVWSIMLKSLSVPHLQHYIRVLKCFLAVR